MVVPTIRSEQAVHDAVKIFVVRKLNMPTNVPSEPLFVHERPSEPARFDRCFDDEPIFIAQLMEPPRRTQAGWARADNQYVICDTWLN